MMGKIEDVTSTFEKRLYEVTVAREITSGHLHLLSEHLEDVLKAS